VSSRDLFGDRAEEYARHRPTYPDALFDHLDRLVERHELAWDCGAGSGQTSRSLAGRFAQVVATDTSMRQLANASAPARVRFVAAAAETAPLRDRCADLVTVSAALHWFDRPRFFAEVRRVARPGAILAVWSYYQSLIEPAIDAVLTRYADQVVELPFEALPWPALEAEGRMRLEDLHQYMLTWSASQAWLRTRGTDPVDTVRDDLARAWGDPATPRAVRWPLHGAIARMR